MIANKTFYLPITQANTLVQNEFDIPREVGQITGIALCANQENLMYARGQAEINISGTDIVKAGERTRQYYFTPNNPQRSFPFGTLDLKNEDRKLRVRYTDQDAPGANFSAYTVEIVLTYIVA